MIKAQAIDRAGRRCTGSPKHPSCRARDGQAHPETDRPTTLHVIRRTPGIDTPENLMVLCMRCVLELEYTGHKTAGWRERRQATGNLELFPIDK